ncbi:DUF4118 domain-containing protein [Sulfuriferula nivalis]|nr:DUF4118 domain-containing protein [Sulfuriferula nivalis]
MSMDIPKSNLSTHLLNIRNSPAGYGWAIIGCIVTTIIATPLSQYLDLVNIVMLFLLTVLLIAARFSRGPAILAAFLSVALFDFFFVPPRFTFAVNDAQYLVTFAVMLTVALITGQLTTGLRRQAQLSAIQAQQTRDLYDMSSALAGVIKVEQVATILQRFLLTGFKLNAVLLLPDAAEQLQPINHDDKHLRIDQRFALIAYEQGQVIEDSILSGEGHGASYFPLQAPMKTRGVVVFMPTDDSSALQEHHALLSTLSSLIAIVIERLHYVTVAYDTQLEMTSERLRSSILSALSHDLRTPLTALAGLAESLPLTSTTLPAATLESAVAIHEQALRLNNLLENLLDMARLHAGRVTLRKEWQLLEEVIGSSIKLLEHSLQQHTLQINLEKNLPLLEYDAVLLERVFCNLLENAAKYAPVGTVITISAKINTDSVEISVADQGPGFEQQQSLVRFEMFARGTHESSIPGVGLGLAICHAIIQAHHGSLTIANLPAGGAIVTFTLPRGNPPIIEEEPDYHEGAAIK